MAFDDNDDGFEFMSHDQLIVEAHAAWDEVHRLRKTIERLTLELQYRNTPPQTEPCTRGGSVIYEPLPVPEVRELTWFEAEQALIQYFGWKPVALLLVPTDNPWHRISDRHAEKEWTHD